MRNYYNLTLDDGISGDDVNRRRREESLGFAPPSPDWDQCDMEIRCIYPMQTIHRLALDVKKGLHVHSKRATHAYFALIGWPGFSQ